uniref:Uncharacterized protein n=1 Tax=Octopus bimaculoides TaxID=37653 RepID=A0A0L8HMX0_OCTBM
MLCVCYIFVHLLSVLALTFWSYRSDYFLTDQMIFDWIQFSPIKVSNDLRLDLRLKRTSIIVSNHLPGPPACGIPPAS